MLERSPRDLPPKVEVVYFSAAGNLSDHKTDMESRTLQKDLVRDIINGLFPRERIVISMRYGVGEYDSDPHTLREIGQLFDPPITRQAVWVLEQKILKRLRELIQE
jgi:DNA-directed RNA polymerase sigma subunit (sigma70/sigma32)